MANKSGKKKKFPKVNSIIRCRRFLDVSENEENEDIENNDKECNFKDNNGLKKEPEFVYSEAEVQKIQKDENGNPVFYVHYRNLNRRWDTWITVNDIDYETNFREKKSEFLTSVREVEEITMGKHTVSTWYPSPFPFQYQNCPHLFVCEYCLKFESSAEAAKSHSLNCKLRHPPGEEIYSCDGISVFEIDGTVAPTYCFNLSLVAKCFIDHKNPSAHVRHFLFYIMTFNDDFGCHIVGYFSKEKVISPRSLNCILTFPQYSDFGFGRLLIEFSYLLMVKEGRCGVPEGPLSDLGHIAFMSFWRNKLISTLKDSEKPKSLRELSLETGVHIDSYRAVLRKLGASTKDGKIDLTIAPELLKKVETSINNAKVHIQPDKLIWVPPCINWRMDLPGNYELNYQ
eukprot:TRINITY_DN2393_c0_g1_i1.p1 TRINITY_DN2393_c0_g1~~TRINITY_DN2393_c0_g1_i1.p1  ORF type:complete len:399 (-),score=89.33 TRINITY_DN2393_c0_g1_i1:355-1551(-)